MYYTAEETATHSGAWARVIRLGLLEVHHWLWVMYMEDDPWDYGIPVFDRLTIGQKLSALVRVGRALLIEAEPAPELTAVVEAAAAVIFEGIESGLQSECEITEGFTEFREAVLAVSERPPQPDELPDATSDEFEKWQFLLEVLKGQVLWDEDYLDEGPYLDVPPEQAQLMKEVMDVEDDYYMAVPEDPPDDKLESLAEELRLLGTAVP